LTVASPLKVHLLDSSQPAQLQRWDEFVHACPSATFFHRAGWQDVIRRVFRHDTYFLYAEQGGEIKGVLPLGHVRSRLFGHSLASLPFAVYGGVAAQDEMAAQALESQAQQIAEIRDDWLLKVLGERYRPDLAMVCVGDGPFTMGPEDAAQACRWLGVSHAMPVHYAHNGLVKGVEAGSEFQKALAKVAPGVTSTLAKPGELHRIRIG